MADLNTAEESLPSSHVFFTISRGRSHRTFAIGNLSIFVGVAFVALASLWSVGCTIYVACHDKLLASLMLHERDMQYDYEDRLAVLQHQLDRTDSQNMMSKRSVEAKLNELAAREAELRTKAGTVARLTQQIVGLAAHPALQADESARAASDPVRASVDVKPSTAVPPVREAVTKPHPDDTLDRPIHEGSNASDDTTDRLAAISAGLGALSATQQHDVAALTSVAQGQLSRYREAVNAAGLSIDRFAARTEASGGPFVPLSADRSLDPQSLTLSATIAEVERLKIAAAHIPFDKPLEGAPEITSPFGPRIDPFLGRPGMHTGVDLREDTGTEVFATAPGRVTVAGQASGYGIMVEIDHGNGLMTRYGHLSATAVSVGQAVKAGETIGLVGATGRATGPHLHYETRIDGEPVDPMRFLIAGHRLFAGRGPIGASVQAGVFR